MVGADWHKAIAQMCQQPADCSKERCAAPPKHAVHVRTPKLELRDKRYFCGSECILCRVLSQIPIVAPTHATLGLTGTKP